MERDNGAEGVAKPVRDIGAQAFPLSHEEETAGDHSHEHGGQERDNIWLTSLSKIHGDGPEGDHGEELVAPGEVAPDDVEASSIDE